MFAIVGYAEDGDLLYYAKTSVWLRWDELDDLLLAFKDEWTAKEWAKDLCILGIFVKQI